MILCSLYQNEEETREHLVSRLSPNREILGQAPVAWAIGLKTTEQYNSNIDSETGFYADTKMDKKEMQLIRHFLCSLWCLWLGGSRTQVGNKFTPDEVFHIYTY